MKDHPPAWCSLLLLFLPAVAGAEIWFGLRDSPGAEVVRLVLAVDAARPGLVLEDPAGRFRVATSVCADGSCGGSLLPAIAELNRDAAGCRARRAEAANRTVWAVEGASGEVRAWVRREEDGTIVLSLWTPQGPADILFIPGQPGPVRIVSK